MVIQQETAGLELNSRWCETKIQQLCAAADLIKFKKGETMFHPEEVNRAIYLLECGIANCRLYSDSGTAVTLLQKRPGDLFGLKGIFNGGYEVFNYYIVAATDVRLRKIPSEKFLALMQSDFEFSKSVLKYFADYVESMEQKVMCSAIRSNYERLILTLIDCAEDKKNNCAEVQISRQDLADLLFVSRQCVFRHLSKLAEQGLIDIRRGKIVILDWVALTKEACWKDADTLRHQKFRNCLRKKL